LLGLSRVQSDLDIFTLSGAQKLVHSRGIRHAFWVTIIFTSFGLLSPRNATVIAVLLVCALSMAGSLFLIQELDRPYEGLIKLSNAPLRDALVHLGQ
jgi:hypothetical protein